MALEKIISGGQTGVDRAALDAALAGDFPCGGWAPLGREAEDGIIPQHYPLDECGQSGTEERTRLNVRDSDATLILTKGADPAALPCSPVFRRGRSPAEVCSDGRPAGR